MDHNFDAYSLTYLILGIKAQPKEAYVMTQVTDMIVK